MTKVRIRRHRHDRSLLRVVMAAVGVIGIGIVLVPWTVSLTDTPPPLALASPRVKTMQVDIKVKQDVPPTEPKESVRNPGVEISDKRRTGRDTYHTVISTGCSTFQDWQSYVFFFHLLHSGQEGPVTRIASGCSEEDAQTLTEIFEKEIATMAPGRFRLHLTPDFSRIKRGTTFKYVRDYMFFVCNYYDFVRRSCDPSLAIWGRLCTMILTVHQDALKIWFVVLVFPSQNYFSSLLMFPIVQ